MIKAIIFDWGGVLGEENTKVAARKLAPTYECDRKELESALSEEEKKYSSGQDNAEYYETISKKFNIPVANIKKTLNEVKSWDVFYLAKELSKKYKVYILSNQMTPRTQAIRNHNDLNFFEEIFFSDELKMQKPNPEIYEYVLKKIGLKGEECIFIDDRQSNLENANKIGIKTILFQDIDLLKRELRDLNITE